MNSLPFLFLSRISMLSPTCVRQSGSDQIKARKKRERIRYQGLLSYAKGVAAATIDGIAPQYIKAAD